MVPVSKLNRLRRDALAALEQEQERLRAPFRLPTDPTVNPEALVASPEATPVGVRQSRRTATFRHPEQITEAARTYFSIRYLPLGRYDNARANGVLLPPVIFDSEADRVCEALVTALRRGAEHILIDNLGHLPLVRRAVEQAGTNPALHGGWRLNVTNTATVAFLESVGIPDVILSPELTLPRIRDVGGDVAAVVYGRLPLMLLEKCVIQSLVAGKKAPDRSACSLCASGDVALRDRMGVRFPVLRLDDTGHRNVLYNSLPLSMTDRADELERARVTAQHNLFTVESADEVDEVIRATKTGAPLPGDVRRINRK